jgi:hypothetical protein
MSLANERRRLASELRTAMATVVAITISENHAEEVRESERKGLAPGIR